MVCGLFANHLSTSSAAMGSVSIGCVRPRYGLYGGAVCSHSASCGRCLSFFQTLGESAGGFDCCARQCFSRLGELPGLFCGAAWNHIGGADLFECAPVLLSMASARKGKFFLQGEHSLRRCGGRSSCNALVWIDFLCCSRTSVGSA